MKDFHSIFYIIPSLILPLPVQVNRKAKCYLFFYFIFHLLSVSIVVPILDVSYKQNNTLPTTCTWLLSFRLMLLNFLHNVACILTSFIFMANQYPIEWLYHTLFIHSSVNVVFKLSHLLAMINNAAMDICVQVFV